MKVGKLVDETENTLRFAIFLLTLHYFRAMSAVHQQKLLWGGATPSTHLAGPEEASLALRTDERAKMDTAAALRRSRLKAIQDANARAAAGFAERAKARARQLHMSRAALAGVVKKRRAEEAAVRKIQAFWRGMIARRACRKWILLKREISAKQAIVQVCILGVACCRCIRPTPPPPSGPPFLSPLFALDTHSRRRRSFSLILTLHCGFDVPGCVHRHPVRVARLPGSSDCCGAASRARGVDAAGATARGGLQRAGYSDEDGAEEAQALVVRTCSVGVLATILVYVPCNAVVCTAVVLQEAEGARGRPVHWRVLAGSNGGDWRERRGAQRRRLERRRQPAVQPAAQREQLPPIAHGGCLNALSLAEAVVTEIVRPVSIFILIVYGTSIHNLAHSAQDK
jgi:hypothetical protein